MMMKLRDHIPLIMIIVIGAFLATIVFSWGMDVTGDGGKSQVVGKIGKEAVGIDGFDREVQAEREKLRESKNGADISSQESRMVPRQVWENKISRSILQNSFQLMGLSASAEEIFQYIRNNPPAQVTESKEFQTNGVFDTSKFEQFLTNPANLDNEGMRMFEKQIRDMVVPMQQLQRLIDASVLVTKVEVAHAYREDNERAVFEYAAFAGATLSLDSNTVTPAMIENFYKAKSDSLFSDEQAVLYYVKVPKVAGAADEAEFVSELSDIKKRVMSHEAAFADEAKVESDDEGSAAQGGELGWFGRGAMVPAFESVAFGLDTGVVSDPIRTPFGYHLIVVEQKEMVKDSVVKVKARHILRKIRPSAQTSDSLEQIADSLRSEIEKSGFAKVAIAHAGLVVDTVGPIIKGKPFGYGLDAVTGVSHFAFNNRDGAVVEKTLEGEDGFYILGIKKKTPRGIPALASVSSAIKLHLLDSLKGAQAAQRLAEVIGKAGTAVTIANLKTIDPTVNSGTTDTVTQSRYIPNVGMQNAAVIAAFNRPVGSVSKPLVVGTTAYVVKPLFHQAIETIPWGTDPVMQVQQRLIMMQRQTVYAQWFAAQRKKISIEDKLDKYYID